jgi:hypothetical protein
MKILHIITFVLISTTSALAVEGKLQEVVQNNAPASQPNSCYSSNAKAPQSLSADLSIICAAIAKFDGKADKAIIQHISALNSSASKILVIANLPKKDSKKDYGPRMLVLKKDGTAYKILSISNGSLDSLGVAHSIYQLNNKTLIIANYFDELNAEITLFELKNDKLAKIGKPLTGEHLDFKALSKNPKTGNFTLEIEQEQIDNASIKQTYELIKNNWKSTTNN